MLDIYRRKTGEHHDSKKLEDSLPSREEEERHQKLLAENEQLKKQIQEVRQLESYEYCSIWLVIHNLMSEVS